MSAQTEKKNCVLCESFVIQLNRIHALSAFVKLIIFPLTLTLKCLCDSGLQTSQNVFIKKKKKTEIISK